MRTRMVGNLRVGKSDVKLTAPSHVKGVREGNGSGHLKRQKGFHDVQDRRAYGSGARSTGINARSRDPIDPRMPNLSPS